jgi:hypothetical protein
MRVGRGGRSVGMTRLGFVARAAAREVSSASASNPQALHEFLRSFAADLQPRSRHRHPHHRHHYSYDAHPRPA